MRSHASSDALRALGPGGAGREHAGRAGSRRKTKRGIGATPTGIVQEERPEVQSCRCWARSRALNARISIYLHPSGRNRSWPR